MKHALFISLDIANLYMDLVAFTYAAKANTHFLRMVERKVFVCSVLVKRWWHVGYLVFCCRYQKIKDGLVIGRIVP